MPNYFYTDASGQRRGPVDDQQLKTLAGSGVITPKTPLETESGYKGTAGQIPGLKFSSSGVNVNSVPLPFDQTAQAIRVHAQQATGSIRSWLFDFSFQDIRINIAMLWYCRIVYVLSWIVTIIGGLWWTFLLFSGTAFAINHSGNNAPYALLVIIIGVPLIWLVCAISMFFTRLCLEFFIVLVDWMVETTKASKLYIENNKRELHRK